MKKFVYATLAAATLFASVGAASAQTRYYFSEDALVLNTGGASHGYNATIQSFDNVK